MTPSTIECARGMRDAGIDAMAALCSVSAALLNELSEQEARELRQLINPVVRAFPELQTDAAAWTGVAKARANARVASP